MEVTRNEREFASKVRTTLIAKVGEKRFEVWFGRGVRMDPCGTTLRIAAADSFRLDYLRKFFRADLLDAARIAAGSACQLDFIVDPAIALSPAVNGASTPAEPVAQTSPIDQALVCDQPAAPRLPRRQFANLADFHACDSNRVAYTAAESAASQPGMYSPLTLVGPSGSGKTHLLEGIWRRVKETKTLQRVVYLSAEQFTNQFLDALRHSGTPNFRRKVRDVEMLLIDDVNFFAGKQSTIVELVHTIDTLLRCGRQLVFSADRPPAEIKALGPELVARLSGGLVCTLKAADFQVRLEILQQLARRQNVTTPPDVLPWLASQLDGDARLLSGALNRLQATSHAHGCSIDLDFAQAAVADLVQANRRPVRLPDIVEAVCDVLGVPAEEVKSGRKTAGVTLPRMLIMFLARKWTRAALSEISHTLGRKSHSTVVSAQHKVTQWLQDGKMVSFAHGQCPVEDAIKKVEAQLRLA